MWRIDNLARHGALHGVRTEPLGELRIMNFSRERRQTEHDIPGISILRNRAAPLRCHAMQLALYSSRQDGKVGDANEADAARLSPGTTFVSNPTAALTNVMWQASRPRKRGAHPTNSDHP
jgi:hypothetical protein